MASATTQSSSLDLARKLLVALPTEERYDGMKIVINFTGGDQPLHSVEALSGGQKTLAGLHLCPAERRSDTLFLPDHYY